VDAQLDDRQRSLMKIDFDPLDVPRGRFIAAGDGWADCRSGSGRPDDYGLGGPEAWQPMGWPMLLETLLADTLALNKVELLPSETNALGGKAYDALTPAELALLDTLATGSREPDAHFAALRERFGADPRCRMPEGWEP
jgi:hypothetical protein